MKRSLKKLLGILLSLVLCLGSFAGAAFSESSDIPAEKPIVSVVAPGEEPPVENPPVVAPPVVEPPVEEPEIDEVQDEDLTEDVEDVVEEIVEDGELDLLAVPGIVLSPSSLSMDPHATNDAVMITGGPVGAVFTATSSNTEVVYSTEVEELEGGGHKLVIKSALNGTATISVKGVAGEGANAQTAIKTLVVTVKDVPQFAEITPDSANLAMMGSVGETIALKATVYGTRGPMKGVAGTWKVADGSSDVITVDSKGLVTAKALGDKQVEFKVNETVSAIAYIYVMNFVTDTQILLNDSMSDDIITGIASSVYAWSNDGWAASYQFALETDASVPKADRAVAQIKNAPENGSNYGIILASKPGKIKLVVNPYFKGKPVAAFGTTVPLTILPPIVSAITLDKTIMNIGYSQEAGADNTAKLVATLALREGADSGLYSVVATSSNAAVVEATELGRTGTDGKDITYILTAKKAGSAQITIKATGGISTVSKTCKVTVTGMPDQVIITPWYAILHEGRTLKPVVKVTAAGKTVKMNPGDYTFVSSDPSVATIDGNGVISVAEGIQARTYVDFNYTVLANGGTLSKNLGVEVLPEPKAYTETTMTITEGDKNLVLIPEFKSNAGEFLYEVPLKSIISTDTKVVTASVDSKTRLGKITAKRAGSATVVTTAYNGQIALIKVNVKPCPVILLDGNVKSITLFEGDFYQLQGRVTVYDDVDPQLRVVKMPKGTIAATTDQPLFVDEDGTFTLSVAGMAPGSTSFTLASRGSKPITVQVKVVPEPNKVVLSAVPNPGAGAGESFLMTATVLDKKAKKLSNIEGTWSCAGPVTVSDSGMVTVDPNASAGAAATVSFTAGYGNFGSVVSGTTSFQVARATLAWLLMASDPISVGMKTRIESWPAYGEVPPSLTYSVVPVGGVSGVVSVDSKGVVTGKKPGSAKVRGTLKGTKVFMEAQVEVLPAPTKITMLDLGVLSPTELFVGSTTYIDIGALQAWSVDGEGQDVLVPATFTVKSSNTKVLTVDQDGLITAATGAKVGDKANVIINTQNTRGTPLIIPITVKGPFASVTIAGCPTNDTMSLGETATVSGRGWDGANGTGNELEPGLINWHFTSETQEVATIDRYSGEITPIAVGTTVITVVGEKDEISQSATFTLTVTE